MYRDFALTFLTPHGLGVLRHMRERLEVDLARATDGEKDATVPLRALSQVQGALQFLRYVENAICRGADIDGRDLRTRIYAAPPGTD